MGWMAPGSELDRVEHARHGQDHEEWWPRRGSRRSARSAAAARSRASPCTIRRGAARRPRAPAPSRSQPSPNVEDERGRGSPSPWRRRASAGPRARGRRRTRLAQRGGHHVEDVARPGLLHEAGRHGDLALEEDVEQHDAGEEVRRGGPADVVLLGDEGAERAAAAARRTPARRRCRTSGAGCGTGRSRGGARPCARAATRTSAIRWIGDAATDRASGDRRVVGDAEASGLDLVLGHDRARQLEEHALEVAVAERVGHIRRGSRRPRPRRRRGTRRARRAARPRACCGS